jgi:hypothetical protein
VTKNWIFSTGTSTSMARNAMRWILGEIARGFSSMPTMVKAAKRTTGMFCVLTKEGWIRLPSEPPQKHRSYKEDLYVERDQSSQSGTKSFIQVSDLNERGRK